MLLLLSFSVFIVAVVFKIIIFVYISLFVVFVITVSLVKVYIIVIVAYFKAVDVVSIVQFLAIAVVEFYSVSAVGFIIYTVVVIVTNGFHTAEFCPQLQFLFSMWLTPLRSNALVRKSDLRRT